VSNGHEKRSQKTKLAILDAAEQIFLEKGFDGGSLSSIARLAGVTQSLISNHFGSKRGLFEVTWMRLLERYFGQQTKELDRPEMDNLDVLRNSIIAYFNHLKNTPGAVRFTAWIFLEGRGDRVPFPDAIAVIDRGIERLRLGQRKGLIRNDVPPEFIWASFIGLANSWFQLREEYEELFRGAVASNDDVDEAYLEALMKIFFEGIGGNK
jgi:AcrR family transcriptional regulator